MSNSYYCHLHHNQRAPLKVILKAVKIAELANTALGDFEFNNALIRVLRKHGWRKRDYVAALKQHERRAKMLAAQMCKRAIYTCSCTCKHDAFVVKG